MTADVEDEFIVAQANEPLDDKGRFKNSKVHARYRDEFLEVDSSKADYMDDSPKMLVSVATAMIPFLENDEVANATRRWPFSAFLDPANRGRLLSLMLQPRVHTDPQGNPLDGD